MTARIATGMVAIAAAALALTACSGYDSDGEDPAAEQPAAQVEETTDSADTGSTDTESTDTEAETDEAAGTPGTALATAETDLGTIVTDSSGMVLYMFDQDTQGGDASACSGGCLSAWPAVPGGDAAPELDGVTGTVGTITGTDGNPQLTLNGWPLYYYAGDSAAGDTTGQGSGNVWWVLTPEGEPIR